MHRAFSALFTTVTNNCFGRMQQFAYLHIPAVQMITA